jgi:DNA-binding GntR family transcriptional regulator
MTAASNGSGTRPDMMADVIADELRTAIISGRLRAGERLIEDVVADEHGVSRVPVREALRRLESEGFVTRTPYRGASVSGSSRRDVVEHMQIRRGLESLAAQLAAQARGGDVREQLEHTVEAGRVACLEHRVEEIPALMMEFHQLVAQASGNRQLQGMLDRVLQRISWGFQLDLEHRLGESWSDHAAIARAILNGSPMQAALLMGEHAGKDEGVFRRMYDNEPS